MNLSVGLITCNEEQDLSRTLAAVTDIADEIVIVDSGSTDKTVEIARSFGARVFVEEWKGFGEQKNSLIDKCLGKWILLIDADEELTPALRDRIRYITASQASQYEVYKIRFLSVCFGKKIRYGGWSNFYRIRLFRKDAGRYDNKQVHENFVTVQPVGTIKEYICHYTYRNLEEYFEKFNPYTSKLAEQYHAKGRRKSAIAAYLIEKFIFFKAYFLQLGFLDGYEGYLLAKLGAMYVFVKFAKCRELKK